jgi:hypothetical protein
MDGQRSSLRVHTSSNALDQLGLRTRRKFLGAGLRREIGRVLVRREGEVEEVPHDRGFCVLKHFRDTLKGQSFDVPHRYDAP